MDSPLDLTVAQGLARWRLVERALHEHRYWTMRYNGVEVPVCKFIRPDRISMVGHFPPMCMTVEPDLHVELLWKGGLMRTMPIPEPLDEDGSECWLHLTINAPAPVA